MTVQEFVERVEQHPRLTLVHRDQTICVVRYAGPEGPRETRLGLWAVQDKQWEHLLNALCGYEEVGVA
jgi:hypothetical protein